MWFLHVSLKRHVSDVFLLTLNCLSLRLNRNVLCSSVSIRGFTESCQSCLIPWFFHKSSMFLQFLITSSDGDSFLSNATFWKPIFTMDIILSNVLIWLCPGAVCIATNDCRWTSLNRINNGIFMAWKFTQCSGPPSVTMKMWGITSVLKLLLFKTFNNSAANLKLLFGWKIESL